MHTRKHNTEGQRQRPRQEVPADEIERFRAVFRDAPYYSTGRDWGDYVPAYRYGLAAFAHHRGQRFDEVESILAEHWDDVRGQSRLAWAEARGAVQHAWHAVDQRAPRRRAPATLRRDDH